jgi:membrane protein implicated in regulation of membrane protease activity
MSEFGVTNFVLTPWVWLVAAAVLAGLEIVTPGAFMIWLAGASVVSALVAAVFAPAWETQLMLFVVLAVISVICGRIWVGRRLPVTHEPGLNRRSDRMVGAVVVVVDAVTDGVGRVQVGDSPWPCSGPDMPVGAKARVVRVDGTTLVVDQATSASG